MDPLFKGVFKALEKHEGDLPLVNFRTGDLKEWDTDTTFPYHSLWVPTCAATLFAYLGNTTVDPDLEIRRFTRAEGEDCYSGYYIDDWFRAFFHFSCFIRRRMNTNVLGKTGPVDNKAGKVAVFSKRSTVGILAADDRYLIPENVDASRIIAIANATQTEGIKLGTVQNMADLEKKSADFLAPSLWSYENGDAASQP